MPKKQLMVEKNGNFKKGRKYIHEKKRNSWKK